jgi:hypothetical protein
MWKNRNADSCDESYRKRDGREEVFIGHEDFAHEIGRTGCRSGSGALHASAASLHRSFDCPKTSMQGASTVELPGAARIGELNKKWSKSGPEFNFPYKEAQTDAPKEFGLKMRRGKNANIAITFDHENSFCERASDRTRPLSIFVPGLAGVALSEERRTDAIVTAGIAQGDANLYLRNVLLRLTLDQQKLDKFHSIIGEVFSDLKVSSDFNEHVHTHIEILVEIDGNKIPLELVGAGALQAIQLVAYATMYDPGLLLLDEPDVCVPDEMLQRWPVWKRVNSSKAPADDPTLIDPIDLRAA